MTDTPAFALSPFQARVMQTPEEADLLLCGGRGGGKSWAMALLFLRHAEQHGGRAKMLYARQTFPGVVDFEAVTREVFGAVYGRAASYNAAAHLWRFPSGATLQLDQIEGPADFIKFQGRSYTLIGVDEAGQYADPSVINLLRSCLRAASGVSPRFVMSANPGGAGHAWLARQHVLAAAPWAPYTVEHGGRPRVWINAPSTYRDNTAIDHADYAAQLAAATATDPELGRAWADGDWTVARGAFFAAVLSQDRVLVEPALWSPEWLEERRAVLERRRPGQPRATGWRTYLAHDYGVSAPSVTYIVAESPGGRGPDGRFYARGSLVLLDELATCEPGSLSKGMGYVVPTLAERVRHLAERWGMRPEGVADDAIFARSGHGAGSISAEFRRCGVYFSPARKADRLTGWERLRRMLAAAGQPDQPGLYVSRACEYWWATVPTLARDPRKPDDVDSRGPDHAADACRYAVVGRESWAGGASFTRINI